MRRLVITQGCFSLALFFLVGCATGGKNLQPQINTLVVADRVDRAVALLNQGPVAYGVNSELLFWLDRGMTYHLSGQYQESINAFAKARRLVDVYYGKSVREIANSWLVNDAKQQYRADEFEVVLINIFQALNYVMLGNIDEALVEARDVDKRLALIGTRHPQGLAHVYHDDAFAWALMGLLWEMEGSSQSNNDAVIAYERAIKVYETMYAHDFNVQVPSFLKDNLARARARLEGKSVDPKGQGEVYIIEYAGFVPAKIAKAFVVPLGFTRLSKISLPDFEDRESDFSTSTVKATQESLALHMPTITVQPVGQMAKQIMKNRLAWLTTKAVLQPALKAAASYVIEDQVRQHYGQWQADAVAILGSIYSLASQEADTRSWQTLPNEIRMTKLVLDQGHWSISIDNQDQSGAVIETQQIGEVDIKAGEKKIFVVRCAR